MKKITLLLLLTLSVLGLQAQTYQLNYDSIRVGKTAGTGGTSLYGKVYLKNTTTGLSSDSILTVRNGRIFKVPKSVTIAQVIGLQDSLNTRQSKLWTRTGGYLTPFYPNEPVQYLRTDTLPNDDGSYWQFREENYIKMSAEAKSFGTINFQGGYSNTVPVTKGGIWGSINYAFVGSLNTQNWSENPSDPYHPPLIGHATVVQSTPGATGTIESAANYVAFSNWQGDGILGSRYGYLISDIRNTGAGSITNQYGVYGGPLSSATNNYFLFSVGGRNYLRGTMELPNMVVGSGGVDSRIVKDATTDELRRVANTGTGNAVYSTSPTLVTPVLGNATGGTLNLSGKITSTQGNNTEIFNSASATTGYQYFNLQNTSGRIQFGIEGSSAGSLLTGGSAYAGVMTTVGAKNLELGTDQTLGIKIDGTNRKITMPELGGAGDVIIGSNNTGLLGEIAIGSGLSLTAGVLTATGGSSGSVTTAGGTAGKIAKFTSASNIENSIMTESSGLIDLAGDLTLSGTITTSDDIPFVLSSPTTIDFHQSGSGTVRFVNNTFGAVNMSITNAGDVGVRGTLAVTGAASASNLSGTNTGDQNLAPYATLASPALTGNPTAPTQTAGDNSTKIATTAYVDTRSLSGTYTPTLTNITNVTSSSSPIAQYTRVGNIVTVFGRFDITPTTASGTLTEIGISLPVASNFTTYTDLNGLGSGTFLDSIKIVADNVNDRAILSATANTASTDAVFYSFSYQVL